MFQAIAVAFCIGKRNHACDVSILGVILSGRAQGAIFVSQQAHLDLDQYVHELVSFTQTPPISGMFQNAVYISSTVSILRFRSNNRTTTDIASRKVIPVQLSEPVH